MKYFGNNPIKNFEEQTFTPTSNQTSFTITNGYTVGKILVYLNGVKLLDTSDYTATNGSAVVLTTGALTTDKLTVIKFK
jgi:hypothetical protein